MTYSIMSFEHGDVCPCHNPSQSIITLLNKKVCSFSWLQMSIFPTLHSNISDLGVPFFFVFS